MDIKIIGANLGRTGTRSLQQALEILGFGPCQHMSTLAADDDLCGHWLRELEKLDGERKNWDLLLGGYHSVVDWPSCLFVEELLCAAPDAKVIYTTRDFDSWYQSIAQTIIPALQWANNIEESHRKGFIQFASEVIGERTFHGRFDRDSARRVYRRQLEQIQALVPADRRLLFDVREGWQPLCEFLQCAIPPGPFPQENAAADFFGLLRKMRANNRKDVK